MASITNSMPLLGERSPNVRMTVLLPKPSLAFDLLGLDERKVGSAVRDDLDLFHRRPVHGAQQFAALVRHDDDPR